MSVRWLLCSKQSCLPAARPLGRFGSSKRASRTPEQRLVPPLLLQQSASSLSLSLYVSPKLLALSANKRELEYGIPRLHSPVNSRRFPDIFGDFCENKTVFLQVFMENRFLPQIPVGNPAGNRSPYTVLNYSLT